MARAALVYTPDLSAYDLGPSHPLRPVRVARTYELIEACGLLKGAKSFAAEPSPADEETIALIHSPRYMAAVRAAGEGGCASGLLGYGLGTSDNPVIPDMYQAAALIVGASVQAADLVREGTAAVAFNPAGGLHHAHRSRAAGFCVFNDPAIAIAHLLRRCGEGVKVAYIDIDAHHGDGVQEAFYQRRDVLTISVHESGRYLFPFTGAADDIGEGEGEGFSVNLPLSPYTGDEVYTWVFQEAVLPLLEAFSPDFVVTQLGVDTHCQDPLTHLCCTTRGYMSVVEAIAQRAPRWIALGGGGYDITVVPRAWTLAFARMAGRRPPVRIPERQAGHYRPARRVASRLAAAGGAGEEGADRERPVTLHDLDAPVVDDEWHRITREVAEQSVREVRERVFRHHGLSPGGT